MANVQTFQPLSKFPQLGLLLAQHLELGLERVDGFSGLGLKATKLGGVHRGKMPKPTKTVKVKPRPLPLLKDRPRVMGPKKP